MTAVICIRCFAGACPEMAKTESIAPLTRYDLCARHQIELLDEVVAILRRRVPQGSLTTA
jgi:hypothetical protein